MMGIPLWEYHLWFDSLFIFLQNPYSPSLTITDGNYHILYYELPPLG